MTNWKAVRRAAFVLTLWLVVGPAVALAASPSALINTALNQEPLARAKALYASAEFEEALRLLETLKGTAASLEASAYQVYCLVALGRQDEARKIVERIVTADPFYRPAEGQVAPRIATFFNDARKPLLPEAVRKTFANAKSVFDKGDMTSAVTEFTRAIALIDEVGPAGQDLADLRVLAVGFRDLARVTADPIVYDAQDANVTAPIPVSKPLPEWKPSFLELNQTFSGSVAVVIGEEGQVLSASMVSSVHPRYDGPLLEAAKSWKFTPATKSGVPVRYRFVMPIRVMK